MTSHPLDTGHAIGVAIIGGGPAGLAAATVLKQAGVARVVVLEREPEAGGIARHCGHPPFGMREFKRILRGPAYAARLVERARGVGVEIHPMTTVVKARPGGNLLIATPAGLSEVSAQRVIYATGVRETPRSARLISGARVQGVMNTGALQSMVYLKNRRPFRRPVILGSELVAISAVMTCLHAGIRPVAMLEPCDRVTARWPSGIYPRLRGVSVFIGTRLTAIHGDGSVEAVSAQGPDGKVRRIACDGVILSGRFTPESTLARSGHIQVDPATGGPVVDQWGRCSDPAYFATGNLLRPVETAGWSWNEGCQTGQWVGDDLAGRLPGQGQGQGNVLAVSTSDPRLKYVMPQRLVVTRNALGMGALQLRVTQSVKGELVARNDKGVVWRRRIDSHPERRLLIPLSEILSGGADKAIEFAIRDTPV